jgi:DNA polymerase sigma
LENYDIDLMVNKTSEVLNSELVREYAQLDERFMKIAHILKAWNKQYCF